MIGLHVKQPGSVVIEDVDSSVIRLLITSSVQRTRGKPGEEELLEMVKAHKQRENSRYTIRPVPFYFFKIVMIVNQAATNRQNGDPAN